MIQREKMLLGVKFDLCYKSVVYCIEEEKKPSKQTELIQIIISVVCLNLWKITCAMVIQQTVTDSDMVIKQVFADPRRKRGQTNLSTSPEIYWIYDLTTFYNRSLNSMHLINACTITGCTLLLTKFPNLVNIFCIMKSNKRSLKKRFYISTSVAEHQDRNNKKKKAQTAGQLIPRPII